MGLQGATGQLVRRSPVLAALELRPNHYKFLILARDFIAGRGIIDQEISWSRMVKIAKNSHWDM